MAVEVCVVNVSQLGKLAAKNVALSRHVQMMSQSINQSTHVASIHFVSALRHFQGQGEKQRPVNQSICCNRQAKRSFGHKLKLYWANALHSYVRQKLGPHGSPMPGHPSKLLSPADD